MIIPLLIMYAGVYRKIRRSFILGLMAVIFALDMYAVTSNPLRLGLVGGWPDYIGLFRIVPDLCTTATLEIFIWIRLK